MELNQAYFIGMLILALVVIIGIATPIIKLTTVINKLSNSVENLGEKHNTLNDRVNKHGDRLDEHDQHFVKVDCELDNLKEAKSNTKPIGFVQESKRGGKR